MDKSLSTYEIAEIANKQITMIPSTDVSYYSDIVDMFATPYVVLNYLSSENYGHWVCMYLRKNGENRKDWEISYFDSYGDKPDIPMEYIPYEYRVESNQQFPYLLQLMIDSKIPINYNNHKLQEYSPTIATCGRWVGYYLRNCENTTIDEFGEYFSNLKKLHFNLDKIITTITNRFI